MKHKHLGAKSATVACYKIENRAIVKHICGKNHKSPTQTEQRNRKQTDEHPIGKTKQQKATPAYRKSRKANKHVAARKIPIVALITKSPPCLIKHYLHAPLFYNLQLGNIVHTPG